MVEAMAQVGAVAILGAEENRGKVAMFAALNDVRFKKIGKPGDVLHLEAKVSAFKRGFGKAEARCECEGDLVCKASLTFVLS